MEKKATSGILLPLLLIVPLTLACSIQPVWALGTIYIRANGSIDPPTASIQRDGDIYSFTADIYDSIVIEKDNIIVDGNSHMIQGTIDHGFFLSERSNVTIENTVITGFSFGITLYSSSKNTISNNTFVSNQWFGISIAGASIINPSSNNTIVNNSVSESACGIQVHGGSEYYNRIENNKVYSNTVGIQFSENARYNVISGNSLSNNDYGFMIMERPADNENYGNKISHNSFVENAHQAVDNGIGTMWDDGYPSGGNYWSDYVDVDEHSGPNQDESGNDGIWDQPYVADLDNQDRYPLVNPWVPRTAGVQVGDWVKYSVEIDGYRPGFPVDLNDVEWGKTIVQVILGTTIGVELLWHLKNGTEISTIGTVDVTTSGYPGPTSMTGLFVSKDLPAGATLYATYPFGAIPPSLKINETVFKEYLGVSRETNRAEGTQGVHIDAYWDKATGILSEFNEDYEGYFTWSLRFEIVDTNLWEAPITSAAIDIDPDTLNSQSSGKWITAHIQLPEGYNAEDIDASTILLNGTIAPILDPKYDFVTNSSEYLVDHDSDGMMERMVKFDRVAVESFIVSPGIRNGNVTLTITGRLFDGTLLEGTDIILVSSGGPGGRRR